jgi:predicted DNA-binding transcriptional regulator YafY
MSAAHPLADELGTTALPPLDVLTPAEIETLRLRIRTARQRQKQQLAGAFEAALNHIPALLRGPVRKILFP